MKNEITTYKAHEANGTWFIDVSQNGEVYHTYEVTDKYLNDDDRNTLEHGTSNDLLNFVNNSGNF